METRPPIDRGETETNLSNFAGQKFLFHDIYYSGTSKGTVRQNFFNRCRLVKNSSGIALLPKRVVRFKAGTNMTEVDGYTTTTAADAAGIVDEWLPSAGVANGDYFWMLEEGYSNLLTDLAGADDNVITEGAYLVALTAATSQATTAGRVKAQSLTGSSQATDYTTITNNQANAFARALSAKTTANTNADVYAFVKTRLA